MQIPTKNETGPNIEYENIASTVGEINPLQGEIVVEKPSEIPNQAQAPVITPNITTTSENTGSKEIPPERVSFDTLFGGIENTDTTRFTLEVLKSLQQAV